MDEQQCEKGSLFGGTEWKGRSVLHDLDGTEDPILYDATLLGSQRVATDSSVRTLCTGAYRIRPSPTMVLGLMPCVRRRRVPYLQRASNVGPTSWARDLAAGRT